VKECEHLGSYGVDASLVTKVGTQYG